MYLCVLKYIYNYNIIKIIFFTKKGSDPRPRPRPRPRPHSLCQFKLTLKIDKTEVQPVSKPTSDSQNPLPTQPLPI